MKHASEDSLVPSRLFADIEAIAAVERRAPTDVVADAVEQYLSERRRFQGDDVRSKIAQGLESLRQGKGLGGEAVMEEILAELVEPVSER